MHTSMEQLFVFLKRFPYKLLLGLIIFFAAFLYVWPFLKYPAFNVIDDGASIRVSRDLLNDAQAGTFARWPSLLIETQEGRLRPVYHLFFLLIYALFGARPLFFWLGQASLLGVTLVLMYLFL